LTSSAKGRADLADQAWVPGGAERDANGEAGRFDAADERAAAAGAVGAIGDAQLTQAQPFDGWQRPEILARKQADLLLQAHRIDQIVYPGHCVAPSLNRLATPAIAASTELRANGTRCPLSIEVCEFNYLWKYRTMLNRRFFLGECDSPVEVSARLVCVRTRAAISNSS
jgi:hypothetical protein